MITFQIEAVTGGYQAMMSRSGSLTTWPVTGIYPTEDLVMQALATSIYLGGIWDLSEWNAGDWGL